MALPIRTGGRNLLFLLASALSLLFFSSCVASAGTVPPVGERVTVYYFHSSLRCETCLFVEGLAEATLRAEFPEEFVKGTLSWRPLDRQHPENGQFITQFDLTSNDLVVVRESAGAKPIWEKIPDLWEQASTRNG